MSSSALIKTLKHFRIFSIEKLFFLTFFKVLIMSNTTLYQLMFTQGKCLFEKLHLICLFTFQVFKSTNVLNSVVITAPS